MGGVILTISIVTLVFSLVSLGLVVSYSSSAGCLAPLLAGLIYDGLGPFFWGSGALTALVGGILMLSASDAARKSLSNVWVLMLIVNLGLVCAYGIRMVLHARNIFMVRQDSQALVGMAGVAALKKLGNPSDKLVDELSPGGGVFEFVGGISDALILQAFPYPFNFVYFMGMRPDVGAVLYVVLPGVFTLFCIPIALSIRNYFCSDNYGVSKHRDVYSGVPLSRFMCGSSETASLDYEDGEEDLASTFAGSSEEDEESLLESSNVSSR